MQQVQQPPRVIPQRVIPQASMRTEPQRILVEVKATWGLAWGLFWKIIVFQVMLYGLLGLIYLIALLAL